MREALDKTDGREGVDDVSKQASVLDVSDDYKEVKARIINPVLTVNRKFLSFTKGLITISLLDNKTIV